MRSERIEAPWTKDQVDRLNAFQARQDVHPFTCPGGTPRCVKRELVATPDGWECHCGEYHQTWVHAWMAI
jgi:hypothetical protein